MSDNRGSLQQSSVQEMTRNPFNLTGKTILITGASSGIGRASAIEISNMGCASCLLVARNRERLEETATLLNPECGSSLIECDLSSDEQIEVLVKSLPKLDGLVCNAGINRIKPLQFCSESDVIQIFQVNCFSSMALIRQLLKKKKLNPNASIVFTASISGYSNVSIGNAMYGASKSALTAFMRYAALELAGRGIRVNAVHPGRIETPLIHSGVTDAEAIEKDKLTYPLKRYGRPEEVAYAIIYLLSDAAAWVTGTSLVIDGGKSLV